MTEPALIPSNRTPWEAAIEGTNAARYPLPVELITATWSADDCPIDLLPYLAWAMSVDVWDKDWPETTKREAIRKSLLMHRLKTTAAGIKEHVALAGSTVKRIIRPPARGFMRTGMTDAQRLAWLDGLPQIRIYPFANKLTALARSFYYGRAVERLFPSTWIPDLDNWALSSSGVFTRVGDAGWGNSISAGLPRGGAGAKCKIVDATKEVVFGFIDPVSGRNSFVYLSAAAASDDAVLDALADDSLLVGANPEIATGASFAVANGDSVELGFSGPVLHCIVNGNIVGVVPTDGIDATTPLKLIVQASGAGTQIAALTFMGNPPQYGAPNGRRPSFYRSGIFARKSRGLNEYGRRATFYDRGVETPVSWTGLEGDLVERIAIATADNRHTFYGRGSYGRGYMQETVAPTNLYTIRGIDSAQPFAIEGAVEPVDVRPQRISQRRTAPGSRMFFGRHSYGHFMRASAAPLFIYDRIAINDPTRIVARRKSSSHYGHGRYGIDPYTAEIRISVPMKRGKRRAARWMGVGFLKAPDMSPLNKAIEAVRSSKAFRDTILIDTANYGRATFGGDLRFGDFSFGQILEVD